MTGVYKRHRSLAPHDHYRQPLTCGCLFLPIRSCQPYLHRILCIKNVYFRAGVSGSHTDQISSISRHHCPYISFLLYSGANTIGYAIGDSTVRGVDFISRFLRLQKLVSSPTSTGAYFHEIKHQQQSRLHLMKTTLLRQWCAAKTVRKNSTQKIQQIPVNILQKNKILRKIFLINYTKVLAF